MHRQSSVLRWNTWSVKVFSGAIALGILLMALPAQAHHMIGGKMPSNFSQGLLSGLGHPIIGPDHFAFMVAVGLLAAVLSQGVLVPIVFVLTAMAGAGLHLQGLELPGVEFLISGSVVLFGMLLALRTPPQTGAVLGLVALAGIFHGYAYGEAIFGAEMTPLLAYLLGFSLIQLIIALSAYGVGRRFCQGSLHGQTSPPLRSAGLVICGMGLAFLTSQLVTLILPVPQA